MSALFSSGAIAQEAQTLSDGVPIDPRRELTHRVHRHPQTSLMEGQDFANPKNKHYAIKDLNTNLRTFEVFIDAKGAAYFQSLSADDLLQPLVPAPRDPNGLILDWAQKFKFYKQDVGWVNLTKQDAIRFWGEPVERGSFSTFSTYATSNNQDEQNIFHLDLKFGDNFLLKAYRVRGCGIAEPVWISDVPTPAPTVAEEHWHTKALTNKTVGADVNKFYYLVGLPKSCICQFMSGTPAYSEHGHDFYYTTGDRKIFMEVEYSADGLSIHRFRFTKKYTDAVVTDKFGGWQTENLRQHVTDFTHAMSIVLINEKRDHFEIPFASDAFESKKWKSDELCRRWCLFDLAHNYPIIGMTHTKLIEILGTADFNPQAQSEISAKFDLIDKYVLIRGNDGPTSILKIAYKDNKAVAFCVGTP